MATSKVYQGFVPTLSTDYTEYLTLESGITVAAFRLEQVDRNIWALTFAGDISTPIPANTRRTIAHYDLTKLPALTGYITGFLLTVDATQVYPENLFFTANGDIDVYNLSSIQATKFSGNGMIYRRLS